jgi:MFS family permease
MSIESVTGDQKSVSRQHHNITFGVLALSAVAYAFQQSTVLPALPEIEKDLHASATATAWLLTGFLLSTSVLTPIVGRLGDMFGKKRILVGVLMLLTFGSVVSALASSISVLIAGRVLQGSAGAVFPLAYGIIRDEFPPERSAHGIALISSILGIGTGAGIVLAGPIISAFGYHFLFWIPLSLVLVALVATIFLVPESPIRAPGRIDWWGALGLALWLTVFLLGISQAAEWGWADPRTLGMIAAGLFLGAGWVWQEMRTREPLIHIELMRIRGVWTVNAAAALVGCGMYSAFIIIPKFAETPSSSGYGFSASVTEAGLFMLPATLCMLVGGPLASWLGERIGSRITLVASCLLVAISFGIFAVAHSEPIDIYVSTAFLGLGIGLAFAALANRIVEAVPPGQTAVATGVNTVMRTVGGAAGSQAGATIIAGTAVVGALPTVNGYVAAAVLSGVAAVAAAIAAFASPRLETPGLGAVAVA